MRVLYVKTIGQVKNGVHEPLLKEQWREVISEIAIEPAFVEALVGVELYRYIVVLFWMHKAIPATAIGSFATCAPKRPNPIGITFVELLGIKGNILRVKGLDAFDGTPVLDIKPYKPWSLKGVKEAIPDINLRKPGE